MSMNFPMLGMGAPVQTFPGSPIVNTLPIFDGGVPNFDGRYAHNLTNTPYTNYLLEDVNAVMGQLSGPFMGYPPLNPTGWPPQGGGIPTGSTVPPNIFT